jgi:two-component system OmpR family response regulator
MGPVGQHILIVEDDPEIAELVGQVIAADGYRVSRAGDARAGQRLLKDESVDLMVLDLMLPGKDGLTFCRELRAEGVLTPIIMLTAKGDDFDRVLGLEMGADDYLPKPFHSRELLARIRAVLRRSEGPKMPTAEAASRFISFDDWRLDTGKRELISNDDVVVLLSSAEYELLTAFLTWPQVVLSREKLLDATHGRSAVISDRSIDIQVSRLRRKLGDDPRTPRIIKTVWGDGYLFTPDVT